MSRPVPLSQSDLPAHSDPRGVLTLAYWYPPENESGALRPYRFCKYLPRCGYRPFVVSAPYHGNSVNLADVVRSPLARPWSLGMRIADFAARAVQRVAPYNDRLEWVPHAYSAASALLVGEKTDVVVSTSPPVATHLVALLLKRRRRLAWVADFRDPMVGNPFRSRPVSRWYDRSIERRVVETAEVVVVNTDAALEVLEARYPEAIHKLRVIWNGYDPEDGLAARPIPPRAGRILAHFGSIYGGRHPGLMLESVARLRASGALAAGTLKIRLVGTIDREESWWRQAACTSLVADGTLDYNDRTVPRHDARREMAESDYLLLLDLNERATGLQVPAKIFEYVQIGRPILALTVRGSPVERILAQSGVSHVCIHADDDPSEVDKKVLEFFEFPTDPVRPSDWFRQRFNAVTQTETLASAIEFARSAAAL